MTTNLLWYVLAGFLVGFICSTFSEWFYFRKLRLKLTDRRIRELEAKLEALESEPIKESPTPNSVPPAVVPTVASVTAGTRTSAWGDTAYRSPGVFLESEEADTPAPARGVAQVDRPTSPQFAPPAYVNPAPTNQPGNQPISQPNGPAGAPVAPASTSNFVPNTPLPSANQVTTPPQNQLDTPLADPAAATRGDQLPPADALRAKRMLSQRTRQEVLAALRRNSEAVERGEQLPPTEIGPATPANIGAAEKSKSALGPAELPQKDLSPIPAETAPDESAPTKPEEPPLSAVRQRWFNNPELTDRSKEFPDDLSKIKGIGDVYKQRLYRAGIYTWKQIAEADEDTLRRATSAYPSSNVDEWHGQAQKLMDKFGRQDAIYHGPPPDDMTKILGIGPVGAAVLYRAGICTYEQLAKTSIDDLQALFPIAVAGDQPDFSQWVGRSTTLADEKYADK